jgi:hypothetical protein
VWRDRRDDHGSLVHDPIFQILSRYDLLGAKGVEKIFVVLNFCLISLTLVVAS